MKWINKNKRENHQLISNIEWASADKITHEERRSNKRGRGENGEKCPAGTIGQLWKKYIYLSKLCSTQFVCVCVCVCATWRNLLRQNFLNGFKWVSLNLLLLCFPEINETLCVSTTNVRIEYRVSTSSSFNWRTTGRVQRDRVEHRVAKNLSRCKANCQCWSKRLIRKTVLCTSACRSNGR